jgi:hypothetical protein
LCWSMRCFRTAGRSPAADSRRSCRLCFGCARTVADIRAPSEHHAAIRHHVNGMARRVVRVAELMNGGGSDTHRPMSRQRHMTTSSRANTLPASPAATISRRGTDRPEPATRHPFRAGMSRRRPSTMLSTMSGTYLHGPSYAGLFGVILARRVARNSRTSPWASMPATVLRPAGGRGVLSLPATPSPPTRHDRRVLWMT